MYFDTRKPYVAIRKIDVKATLSISHTVEMRESFTTQEKTGFVFQDFPSIEDIKILNRIELSGKNVEDFFFEIPNLLLIRVYFDLKSNTFIVIHLDSTDKPQTSYSMGEFETYENAILRIKTELEKISERIKQISGRIERLLK